MTAASVKHACHCEASAHTGCGNPYPPRACSAPAGAGDFLHQRRKSPKTPPGTQVPGPSWRAVACFSSLPCPTRSRFVGGHRIKVECRLRSGPATASLPLPGNYAGHPAPLAGGPTDSHAGDIGHRLGMTDGSARRFPFAKLTCHCEEGDSPTRQSASPGACSSPPAGRHCAPSCASASPRSAASSALAWASTLRSCLVVRVVSSNRANRSGRRIMVRL